MIKKYAGLFCVNPACKKFSVFATYEVERPEEIGTYLIVEPDEAQCQHCGNRVYYKNADVAHCTSPSGAEPQYPSKR